MPTKRLSSKLPASRLPLLVRATNRSLTVPRLLVAVAAEAVVAVAMMMARVAVVAVAVTAVVMARAAVVAAVMAKAAAVVVVMASAVVAVVVTAVPVEVAVVAPELKERMVKSRPLLEVADLAATAAKRRMVLSTRAWTGETALAVAAVVTARKAKAKELGVARRSLLKKPRARKRRSAPPLRKRPSRLLSLSLKKRRKRLASPSMTTSHRSRLTQRASCRPLLAAESTRRLLRRFRLVKVTSSVSWLVRMNSQAETSTASVLM